MLNAYINVELCSSITFIKYVCKYIDKESDMATYRLQPHSEGSVNLYEVQLDEKSQYHNGRYIRSREDVWKILDFPIHEQHPPIVPLAVHLENQQSIYQRPERN